MIRLRRTQFHTSNSDSNTLLNNDLANLGNLMRDEQSKRWIIIDIGNTEIQSCRYEYLRCDGLPIDPNDSESAKSVRKDLKEIPTLLSTFVDPGTNVFECGLAFTQLL